MSLVVVVCYRNYILQFPWVGIYIRCKDELLIYMLQACSAASLDENASMISLGMKSEKQQNNKCFTKMKA